MGKLLQLLFTKRNISYTIIANDGTLGTPFPNGSWTGMSGLLQRNEVDIFLGPPLMSFSRTEIMDFSVPLMFDQNSILSHRPDSHSADLIQYLSCYNRVVWSLILISLLKVLLFFIFSDHHLEKRISFKSVSDWIFTLVQISLLKSKQKLISNLLKVLKLF